MNMQFDNPFPGMNPYLERSDLWPDFHNDLIAQLREELGPRLPVRYRIALEERVEIGAAVGPPLDLSLAIPDALVIDEHPAPETVPPGPTAALAAPSKGATAVRVPVPREIRVTWLRVEALPERDVVTVVEVLSPANKSPGRERQRYVRKREAIFAGGVNLVEIDLLRAGEPMPLESPIPSGDYRVLVFEGWRGPDALLHTFSVQQAIPKFSLPLLPEDESLEVDLGPIIDNMHLSARYGKVAGYHAPPPGPPCEPKVQAWIENRVETFLLAA